MTTPAVLALEDGTVFRGVSIGAAGTATGEVVFNTAMTGYQEILTDPSYSRQIVTLTYPHIGNTGTNPEDLESRLDPRRRSGHPRPAAAALATGARPSRCREFLVARRTSSPSPSIDTRKLTRILREKGAQAGCIASGDAASTPGPRGAPRRKRFPGLKGMDLAKVGLHRSAATSGTRARTGRSSRPRAGGPGQRLHVVAYDFGIKRNILRLLADHGCRMTVVPAQTTADEVLALEPGRRIPVERPGRSGALHYAIEAIRAFSSRPTCPIFGICLGHQLLGLASGRAHDEDEVRPSRRESPGAWTSTAGACSSRARTTASRSTRRRCPPNVRADPSLAVRRLAAGHRAASDRPAFSFQGHPEASPGPRDLAPLFVAVRRV